MRLTRVSEADVTGPLLSLVRGTVYALAYGIVCGNGSWAAGSRGTGPANPLIGRGGGVLWGNGLGWIGPQARGRGSRTLRRCGRGTEGSGRPGSRAAACGRTWRADLRSSRYAGHLARGACLLLC